MIDNHKSYHQFLIIFNQMSPNNNPLTNNRFPYFKLCRNLMALCKTLSCCKFKLTPVNVSCALESVQCRC